MKSIEVPENKKFIGRARERALLKSLGGRGEAVAVVVFGRRRVGKTELIEQSFRNRTLLKFEGVQTAASLPSRDSRRVQIDHVLRQLADCAESPHIARLRYDTWAEVFDLIGDLVEKGERTLYFEEVQWLAHYEDEFFSELKQVWDNRWRRNPRLVLVLCGSSPSFIVNQLLSDKAFYNRAGFEIPLKPFTLEETAEFLGPRVSRSESLWAHLSCGGIPEYLKRLRSPESVYLGLCRESFLPGSFFAREKEKIFVSSLSANRNFEKTLDFLSLRSYAGRDELTRLTHLASGGTLTNLLEELEACGFVDKYAPLQRPHDTILHRYAVADPYLRYYYTFIHPLQKEIARGDFERNPQKPMPLDQFQKWLGYSFESFCRNNHGLFAQILGFGGVQYRSGAFFVRGASPERRGFQIDLAYDRADGVMTVCEIKHSTAPVDLPVRDDVEKKWERAVAFVPALAQKTRQNVLIATAGATPRLANSGYFSRIIRLEDLFDPADWAQN
jgi:hypothetical protein